MVHRIAELCWSVAEEFEFETNGCKEQEIEIGGETGGTMQFL